MQPGVLSYQPPMGGILSDRRRRLMEMDHGYRAQHVPGSSQYASAAIDDVFPSGNSVLALSGVPGLSDAAGLAADYEMYRDEPESRTAVNYGLSAAGLLPFVPNAAGIVRAAKAPKKTVKGYRAQRVFLPGDQRYGSLTKPYEGVPLYPAMIGKDTKVATAREQQIPIGEWLKSEFVPFKMAPRQGWHAGQAPYGKQFNKRTGEQPHNIVYSEVELGADQDFSNFVDANGDPIIYKEGQELPFGDPGTLPEGGFYLYQAPGGKAPWMVSDYMKTNRVISDEEIADIMRQKGLEPPPKRHGGPITEAMLADWGLLSN